MELGTVITETYCTFCLEAVLLLKFVVKRNNNLLHFRVPLHSILLKERHMLASQIMLPANSPN